MQDTEEKEYLRPGERIALYSVLVAVVGIITGGIPWAYTMAAKAGQISADVARHDVKINEMGGMSDRLARIETKLDMIMVRKDQQR